MFYVYILSRNFLLLRLNFNIVRERARGKEKQETLEN